MSFKPGSYHSPSLNRLGFCMLRTILYTHTDSAVTHAAERVKARHQQPTIPQEEEEKRKGIELSGCEAKEVSNK
ncbi:hypothetical protein HOLleu_04345 [Holothuria leucospilota]|uniref:Uncharacterized protein n=1 Tax=Holothuria leucospilota TaxID=206669 RepID=A0A9Q1HLU0_HOLLE|nr:hypothetical protein HOLleu_04345 [Holothuria leucospilota]